MRRVFIYLLFSLFLPACDAEFSPAGELTDDPLILAMTADPPWARPTDSVTLDALVHWPGRVPSRLWLRCIPEFEDVLSCAETHWPADGQVPTCTDDPDAALCLASTDATATMTVPADLIPTTDVLTVYAHLAVSADPDPTMCLEAMRTQTPSERCLLSAKRILVVPEGLAHANPRFADITLDGTTLATATPLPAPDTSRLTIGLDPASLDELDTEPGSPVTHYLGLALYTDCGTIAFTGDESLWEEGPYNRTISCTEPADGTQRTCTAVTSDLTFETAGACTLYLVVRDNLGGIAHHTTVFYP